MKRKALAAVLALLLLVCLISGCASKEPAASAAPVQENAPEAETPQPEEETPQPEEETPQPEAETPQPEAPAEPVSEPVSEPAPAPQPVVIEYPLEDVSTGLSVYTTTPSQVNSILDILAFTEASARTGVDIEWQEVSFAASTERLNLMLASGDYPDMIVGGIGSSMTPDEAVGEEVLADLTDYLEENAPKYAALLEDDQLLREIRTSEGRIAAFYQVYDDVIGIRGDLIRQDWLDELGLEVPETYDQLTQVLTAFKAAYNCEHPYLMSKEASSFRQLNAGFGIPGYSCGTASLGLFVVDDQVQTTLLAEGYRAYIEMLSQWYSQGLIGKDFVSIESSFMDQTRKQLFLTDQVGVMYVSNNASVDYPAQAQDPDFATTPLKHITQEEGQSVHFTEDYSRINSSIAVFADCVDIPLACQFLDYFYTEEGSLLATYGVEGIDWEYNAQGKPAFTDKVMNHASLAPNMAMQTVTMSMGWVGLYPIGIKTYFYQDQQFHNSEVWMSNCDSDYVLIGATSPLSEDADVYSSTVADITTYADTMVLSFIVGEKPLTQWDEFIDTMKEMGIEDCVAAIQRAYDHAFAQ